MSSPEKELARLLAEMFSPEELYTFLRTHVDRALADALPGRGSLGRRCYASRAAEKIVERGLARAEFFEAWISERPHRAGELAELAELAGEPLSAAVDRDAGPARRGKNLFIDRPFVAPVLYIVYSLGLLTMSHVLDLDDDVFDIGNGVIKKTSYIYSPNWSIGLGIIAPLCLYFLLSAVRRVMELPVQLARRGMVVEERDGVLVPLPEVEAARRLQQRGMAGWSVYRWILYLLICLSVLFAAWYWWENSMDPRECVQGGFLAKSSSFGFFAVAMLVPLLAMVSGYICVLYALLGTARDLIDVDRIQGEYLVPDFASEHERGFEVFGRTIIDLLLVLFCLFLMAYLARLWSVFFHDGSQETFYEFVLHELPTMLWRSRAHDLTSVLVIFGAIIGVIFGAFIPLSLLGEMKQIARDRLPCRALAGRSPEAVKEYLDRMRYWPIQFPGKGVLIALATMTCLSIIFCWLALLTLTMLTVVIVVHYWRDG